MTISERANSYGTYFSNQGANAWNAIKTGATDVYNNGGTYLKKVGVAVRDFFGKLVKEIVKFLTWAKDGIVHYYNRARAAFSALPEEHKIAAGVVLVVGTVLSYVFCCRNSEAKPNDGKNPPVNADNKNNSTDTSDISEEKGSDKKKVQAKKFPAPHISQGASDQVRINVSSPERP